MWHRIRFQIKLAWHIAVLFLFKKHIQDVIIEATHPEFGLIWQEGEIGYTMLDEAHACGYSKGFEDGQRVIRLPEMKAAEVEKSKPS